MEPRKKVATSQDPGPDYLLVLEEARAAVAHSEDKDSESGLRKRNSKKDPDHKTCDPDLSYSYYFCAYRMLPIFSRLPGINRNGSFLVSSP